MRIIFFSNNYFPRQSGVAFSIDSLKRNLESLGHQVYVVAPQYSKSTNKNEKRIFRVRSIIIPGEKHFSIPLPFFESRKILQYIKRVKPHLIHVHHPFLLGTEGQKVARLLKIPCVFTYHSLYEYYTHYIPIISNLSRLAVRKMCFDFTNKCDQIIAPTGEIKKYLRRNHITIPIAVVPTGINLDRFKKEYTDQKLASIKQKFGIPLNNQVILHVGRIVKEKKIGLILKSFQVLIQEKPRVSLLFVGFGHHLDYYKKMAQQMGIQKKVIWADFIPRDQLPPIYKLADVFVFTSQCDTQAIVLYESLAAGTPIIATKSMASQEAIQKGKNGLLVSANSIVMANALKRFLEKKQEVKISLHLEKYTEEAIVQKMVTVYQKLIKQ